MQKVTHGGSSLSYSYENHVLKLSQLTTVFESPLHNAAGIQTSKPNNSPKLKQKTKDFRV
jgi:hypothetical protein